MKNDSVPHCVAQSVLSHRLNRIFSKIAVYGRMIKFEHTVFALPFALASLILANRENPVTSRLVFWIIMALVWARSAAMGFNRIVDAAWDKKNPRTAQREIPAGNITLRETALFVLLSASLFIFSAASISLICLILSLPVLLLLLGYSYTKRFTYLSHLALGFVQALGPLGVWLAVTGGFSIKIGALSLALGAYIAGFDLLYACQDVEFDRREGLYSMPANLGVVHAIFFSGILHAITFISLVSLYWIFAMSPYYLVFTSAIGILLILEHRLVKHGDMSKINIAFFHLNSIVSVLLLAAMIVEELVRRGYM